MRTNHFIPLLISGEREDSTEYVYTIINDELLCYQPYWNFYLNPFSAYNSLLLLSENSNVKIIPSELHIYFEGKEPLKENKIWQEKKELNNSDFNSFCLMEVSNGNGMIFDEFILNYNIEVEKDSILLRFNYSMKTKEVSIKKISKQTIERTLKMTPLQTFILLANIGVTYFESFNFFPKEHESRRSEAYIHNMGNDLRRVLNLSKKYLLWLEKKFVSGKIDPLIVLQYNGYKTLSHLLNRPAVQEIPAVQDLLWDTLQIVENYRNSSNLKLILYYTFYRKSTGRDFFKVMRRWGKMAKKIKSGKSFTIEEMLYIREILSQMRKENLEKGNNNLFRIFDW